MPHVIAHHGVTPTIPATAFLAETATVIGDVVLGEHASLWFNVVARGDVNRIRIGARSNVQDNSTIHVSVDTWPTILGDDVIAGHNVLLHGCTVHDRTLIGMGSTLLDGVVVEEECIVAAGTLLTPGTRVPRRSLVMGRPGKVVRPVTDEELRDLVMFGVEAYVGYKETYR